MGEREQPRQQPTTTGTAIAQAVSDAQASSLPLVLRDLGLAPGDVQVLRDTIAKGSTDAELAFFLRFCKGKALDPFARQVHMVKRWDPEAGRETMALQTGIDGYRVIAERTGNYEAGEGPLWCDAEGKWVDVWLDDKNPPKAARFIVHRKGRKLPVVATARFSAYAQRKKDGGLTRMWATMGAEQLAKCAEALALRRAFPEDLASVHTDEEMAQADNAHEQPKPAAAATSTAAPVQSRVLEMRDRLAPEAPAAVPVAAAQLQPVPVPQQSAAPVVAVDEPRGAQDEGDVVDAEYDDEEGDPVPEAAPAATTTTAPAAAPTPSTTTAAPPAVASKGATIQQAERIRDLLDRLGVPRSSAKDTTDTTGPRLMVLRSAAKRANITRVSDLTFEEADAAIVEIASECKRRNISIAS